MDKDKFLKSLDILLFCSLGEKNRALPNLKQSLPKNYRIDIERCISFLELETPLNELGVDLIDLVKFIFKDSKLDSLRYLSIILEKGYERFLTMALDVRGKVWSNAGKEVRSLIENEFNSATTYDDLVIFYTLLVTVDVKKFGNSFLFNTLKDTSTTSLNIIKSKSNKISWYCAVTISNNHQLIKRLEQEKEELESVLKGDE